ncbi:peptidoglycan-binding domain-containing protein [Salipiger mangrovisoli]|uniref:Peptidoglycan-binding protein n=1 Tax=Salipiger mangrovisoli TaxID=2865933 RepID=A0ABR9XAW5_9RHOB|nr:peptidoglycan-binding domain-containing protein [Salipiger mangrovisoli]MBE9640632.1 peptidoglycan-binding protein [Salipiger mangrovisoli]
MKLNSILGVLCIGLLVAPTAAAADNAFVGGLVGGIIGSAIANQPKRQVVSRKSTAPRQGGTRSSADVSSVTREMSRMSQSALNYFGFNAGTPDGILGSQSRAAIASYQAHMGYAATGQLTDYERDFLIGSYHRAQAGGPATARLIAQNPQGVRGLLIAFRDEQMNGSGTQASDSIAGHYGLPSVVAEAVNEIARSSDPSAEQLVQRSGFIQLSDINGDGQTDYILDTSVTGSAFWCNAQSCAVRVFASTPDGYERNDFQAFNVTPAMFTCQRGSCSKAVAAQTQMARVPSPQVQSQPPAPQGQLAFAGAPVPSAQPVVQGVAGAGVPVLPNFFGEVPVALSLQSHCNTLCLMTTANGGHVTEASMTDADSALAEQLCLTRSYAIAQGEMLIAKVPGATAAQIDDQCGGLGALLHAQVAAVSLKPPVEVLSEVQTFILGSGMAPAQLQKTAQICLASGYKADDLDSAIGSALLLVALGQAPYGELLGHHLSQGIGAARRPDLSLGWYAGALDALEAGAAPVFAPGLPERAQLLRKATTWLGGDAPQSAQAPAVTRAGAQIPSFKISE